MSSAVNLTINKRKLKDFILDDSIESIETIFNELDQLYGKPSIDDILLEILIIMKLNKLMF